MHIHPNDSASSGMQKRPAFSRSYSAFLRYPNRVGSTLLYSSVRGYDAGCTFCTESLTTVESISKAKVVVKALPQIKYFGPLSVKHKQIILTSSGFSNPHNTYI